MLACSHCVKNQYKYPYTKRDMCCVLLDCWVRQFFAASSTRIPGSSFFFFVFFLFLSFPPHDLCIYMYKQTNVLVPARSHRIWGLQRRWAEENRSNYTEFLWSFGSVAHFFFSLFFLNILILSHVKEKKKKMKSRPTKKKTKNYEIKKNWAWLVNGFSCECYPLF